MYILPKPQRIIHDKGFFLFNYEVEIVISDGCPYIVWEYVKKIESDIQEYSGVSSSISKSHKTEKGDIRIVLNQSLPKSVYTLVIDRKGVEINGKSQVEILYGIQTLRQILRQEGAKLPFVNIYDYPEIKDRGYFYDVTRGRVPKKEALKDLADKLSYYKINQLQLYIEHSFMFDGLNEMWRDDTPLTPKDILELDAYCSSINVELVPCLSSFGHLYKLLRTKSFSNLCELPDSNNEKFSFVDRMAHHTLNVTSEGSYKLMERLIIDFLPLFSSNKFNICADETFDLGEGFSKGKREEIGKENMYIDFVNDLCGILLRHGKQPMIWGDIICGFPELTEKLPENLIYLTWGYGPNEKEDGIKTLHEQNVSQYVCPGVGGWNQFINLLQSAYKNIRVMSEYAYRFKAIGILNTDWGDYGHINHPSFSIPAMIYGAAFSWNKDFDEYEDINSQISRVEYGDVSEKICSIIGKLSNLNTYNWNTAVKYMEKHIKSLSYKVCKEFFISQTESLKNIRKTNELIEALKIELLDCAKHLGENRKKIVEPLLISIDGMKLLNEVGIAVARSEYSISVDYKDVSYISDDLEKWFMHFKRMWRTVSQESELYRVQNVIFWYADYLRR